MPAPIRSGFAVAGREVLDRFMPGQNADIANSPNLDIAARTAIAASRSRIFLVLFVPPAHYPAATAARLGMKIYFVYKSHVEN